jgi:hypothetical protein
MVVSYVPAGGATGRMFHYYIDIPRLLNAFATTIVSTWYNPCRGKTDGCYQNRFAALPSSVRWHPIWQALIIHAGDLYYESIKDMSFSIRWYSPFLSALSSSFFSVRLGCKGLDRDTNNKNGKYKNVTRSLIHSPITFPMCHCEYRLV